MTDPIDNSADLIDSRDIIARIEDLNSKREAWAAGWNMPGYMPNSEPAAFPDWDSARDYLAEELRRQADYEAEQGITDQAQALQDYADRLEDSARPETDQGETIGQFHYWIAGQGYHNGLTPDEAEELKALENLAEEGENAAPDWSYGETLIRDSYFKEYAQDLAEDIGAIDPNAKWPLSCIDWDQAARELRMDYSSIDFAGVTYWTR